MGPRRMLATTLVLTVGLAACENSLGPDSVRSVELEIERTTLVEGETAEISVAAMDIDGGSISSSEVTWISRDPTTVRVEDGSVIGVAPGVTRVVADIRGARDSVRIRVRFGNLSRGEIGVRLQGEGGVRQAVGGTTIMNRFLSFENTPAFPTSTSIRTRLGSEAPSGGAFDPFSADTLVWITFRGNLEIGSRHIDAFVLDTLNGTLTLQSPSGDGALVSITDPDEPLRTELFTSVGLVDLEIDEVILPSEPGAGTAGILRGAVAFEAAGVIIESDPVDHTVTIVGPASETTLRVYAEFQTDLYEWLIGTARMEVTVDGIASSGYTGTTASLRDGGAEFRLPIATKPDAAAQQELVYMQTRVESSGAGTVTVKALDADAFDPEAGEGGTWSYATIRPAQVGRLTEDVTRRGYSSGGEIILTEYRAPTAETFGMIRGSYLITYTLRDADDVPTGGTMDAFAEFVLPIQPTCGPPPFCN